MNIFFNSRSKPLLAVVVGTLLAVGVSTVTAEAQVFHQRRGVAVGENGAAGRTGGFVGNGEGQGAARRGGFAVDGQGNGFARRGGCANGQTASGCRGGTASRNSDGSLAVQSGAEISGDNGSFSGRRTLARDADGNVTGTRSTEASGESGTYSGASSIDNGSYTRDGTYSGTEGQSVNVNGNWQRGAGGSRAVTCTDATGAVVECR